jgi:cadmium resistance protein CadD (predicted permease)
MAGPIHTFAPPLLTTIDIIKVFVVIGLMLLFHWLMRNSSVLKTATKLPRWLTGIIWSVLLILILLSQGNGKVFIYFQF